MMYNNTAGSKRGYGLKLLKALVGECHFPVMFGEVELHVAYLNKSMSIFFFISQT